MCQPLDDVDGDPQVDKSGAVAGAGEDAVDDGHRKSIA